MPNTRTAHDLVAIAGAIDPQSAVGSTLSSDWVDMSKWSLALFVLSNGVIDATVDFKLIEAKDSIGTGSQDLTGKAIVQAPATDDMKQYAISVSDENLSRNSGFRYVRGVVTIGAGTASTVSVIALGIGPKQLPAIDNKHADCSQTIG